MTVLIFIFWVLFIIFLFLILGTFVLGGISAAPWVPLWKDDIRRMMKIAEVKPGEIVYDLGAGDGRIIIIAATEFGAKATGFEIATLPYLLGYTKIILRGLAGKVKLKYANFFSQDLSQADVICMFLTPPAMKKIKPKLEKETKPGCRIVSYAFSLPGWPPKIVDKPNPKKATIYLYQK
ncbi:MAG: hypothetical protein WC675_01455 [Patescibacteria group bacterium]|jgi:hypothetical protein